jgi:hypothetical protein
VVDLAHARLAVVLPARRERGFVEGVDGVTILDPERHVHAAVGPAIALGDPEQREVVAVPADPFDRLHHEPHSQGREGLVVERLAGVVVAHVQPNVIKSGCHV